MEAGEEQPDISKVPGLYPLLRKSSIDYKYYSQPEPVICTTFENSKCLLHRGKVVGGTSVINDMIYARGNKQDFDDWYSLGNDGWAYEDVLPYFKKSERAVDEQVSLLLSIEVIYRLLGYKNQLFHTSE